jgi:hypothetical protein
MRLESSILDQITIARRDHGGDLETQTALFELQELTVMQVDHATFAGGEVA